MAATFTGRRANNVVSQGLLSAMDLGIADDGERTDHQQAAQIAIALLILPSLSLPPLEFCFGTSPIQAEKCLPDRKAFGSATHRPVRLSEMSADRINY
jgi:hypothetical protein